MKCPICGKELELRNKQIGTNENGDPIFNEYAICRDCKKQWNLDKQRAKRSAAKKAAQEAAGQKESPVKEKAPVREIAAKEADPKEEAPVKKPASKEEAPVKKPAPRRKSQADSAAAAHETSAKKAESGSDETGKRPAPKRRPRPEAESSEAPAKKPVRKRHLEESESAEDKRYSNIPPEKVRNKREKAARKSYEDMLETGTIEKKAVRRKKKQLGDDETGEIRSASSAKSSSGRRADDDAKNVSKKNYEPETDEYDDDEYYDDDPRFRPMRIVLGILSLAAFGYLIYRGFVTGLADTTEGGSVSSGMTYIIVALCMLVSALLYFIMQRKNTIFAFLLPMIFYLGGGIFAFLQRGNDLQLLISAIAGGVLAVISLILAITSRGGGYDDEEDEEYDAFEDDYADEDYDD